VFRVSLHSGHKQVFRQSWFQSSAANGASKCRCCRRATRKRRDALMKWPHQFFNTTLWLLWEALASYVIWSNMSTGK